MPPIVPAIPLPASPADEVGHREADALMTLYDRTLDSVKGYAKMVEKAEPSFRDTAAQFHALHVGHAGELARMLADLGLEADADGTFMGTVNQAVVTFRAFFDDIDDDVMDQIRSGEDWVLKAFDAAIAEQDGTEASLRLREMQAELSALLEETRHLG
jgi:uncharacterized protein (TIGR02284 family)